jgi:hypothetical protein
MCNLSVADVISFIKDGGYETRVVTPDRRFVSLKRGDGAINTSLGKDMLKAYRDRTFIKEIIRRTKEKYRSTEDDSLRNKELENMMNEWLSNNTVKYGYIFTKGRHEL